jgi:hypothetical protein
VKSEKSSSSPSGAADQGSSSIVLQGGQKISVICGNVLECKADVLVNAANNKLDHCGGLAKAIVDKGLCWKRSFFFL